MGEIKEVLHNIKKKKWGKEEWIILILIGVFFLVVFWPDSKQNKEENENIDNIDIKYQDANYHEYDDYKNRMENQLEEVLRSIDGIDNVKAMITLKSSEEEIVLKENKRTLENTVEEDNQGGKREIVSESVEEAVCYGEGPYVTYTISPKVEGVLVVVGGEKASLLRTEIVKAVQALFDVESHKVVVIKMKEV